MSRKYRVVIANVKNTITIMTDWQSYSACKKMIIGRWNHWPPFAYISGGSIDYLEKKLCK